MRLRRARLGGVLALVALAAAAMLALPALAAAEGGQGSKGRANAGTVASFDSESGELTIDLAAGGTVTALVTDDTRIRCVGRKRGHRHGERGRGHRGKDGATSSRREGKRHRRGRGHRCGTAVLTEGATIRKAWIASEEETDAFQRILVGKAKKGCNGDSDGEGGEAQAPGDS